MKKKALLLASILIFLSANAQELVISEVMSSNSSFLADESGWKYPDWIELHNRSNQIINLKGYSISDTEAKPKKWFFPEAYINPNEYMLIFADAEDRRSLKKFDTIADVGDIWRYRVGDRPISVDWASTNYDDSNWQQGPSGFGYGDNDDNTVIPVSPSVFIRKEFNIPDPDGIAGILVHLDFDDSFALYLNGELIQKQNISKLSIYDEPAKKPHEANLYRARHDFVEVWIKHDNLKQGNNLIAIEAHNYALDNSSKPNWVEAPDLSLIPIVSIYYDLDQKPNSNARGASTFAMPAYPYLHTNFKLKDGESLVLSDKDGRIIDKIDLLDTRANESQGRVAGSATWSYLLSPSPKSANSLGFAVKASKVKSSVAAGIYNTAFALSLSAEPESVIFYSLDGTEPTTTSLRYNGALSISRTTVVRARAYRENHYPSLVSTFSYFINEDISFPIVSLVTDPKNLFSNQTGIFAYGKHAEANFAGANFKQPWTRPASLELFDRGGQFAFQADAGLELFGQYSRSKVRKSVELKFKSGFGDGKIKYPVFDNYSVNKFDDLVLRTSSNDYKHTLFRDMLTQSLFKELGLDTQAYKPAKLFINSEYWGLINIREKMDVNYLERHFGADEKNIDLIGGYIKENGKLRGEVFAGNLDAYKDLLKFVKEHDMSDNNNYNYIVGQIDIDNFITYMAAQIYVDNYDWPGRNIKFWRNNGGKWRWLVYDTDFAFALETAHDYSYNSLEHILSDDPSPSWESQPNASLLVNSLLDNDSFKLAFIKKFYDITYGAFEPNHVLARIAEFKNMLEPQMPRHIDRWGNLHSNLQNMNDWNRNIKDLEDFAKNRPAYMQAHLIKMFGQDTVNRALGRDN